MLRFPAFSLLTALLFFFAVAECPADIPADGEEGYTQLLPAENVEMLSLNREAFWRLTIMVRIASKEVDAVLGASGVPKRKLSLLVMEREFSEDEYRGSDIPIKMDEGVPATVWRICRGLLERRAAEMIGGSRRNRSDAIDALAAALTNRIVYDGKGGYGAYRQDYRIPEMQFRQRRFPDVKKLLENAVPPEFSLFFRLYLVHCDLFFQCVADDTGNFAVLLERWLTAQSVGKMTACEAMASALPPGIFRTGENLQAWYERRAVERAAKGMFRNSPEEVVGELEKLTAIPVLDASSSGGIRMIPLEKVPDLLEDYRLDGGALAELQQKLMHLKMVSPLLMQEAIDAYIQAVDVLRNGRKKEFYRYLAVGREQMRAAQKKMSVVEKMLDEAEAQDARQKQLRNGVWKEIIEKNESWRAPLEEAVSL